MAMLDTRGVGAFTLLKRTLKEFSSDDMSTYASALAYRGLFAMFPFLVFLIALLGFLDLQNFFDWLRMQAELALPPVAMEQINPVIDQLQEQQAGLLSFGILVALWTASIGFRSLMNALNKAYDVEEGRPTWKLIILALAYTAGVAVLLLFTAGLMVIGPQAMEWLAGQVGMRELVVVLWTWLRWPVIVLMLMLVVALLYYVAPDVEQEFRFITPGSVLASPTTTRPTAASARSSCCCYTSTYRPRFCCSAPSSTQSSSTPRWRARIRATSRWMAEPPSGAPLRTTLLRDGHLFHYRIIPQGLRSGSSKRRPVRRRPGSATGPNGEVPCISRT